MGDPFIHKGSHLSMEIEECLFCGNSKGPSKSCSSHHCSSTNRRFFFTEAKRMKVKLLPLDEFLVGIRTEWHGVASWTWDAQDETCGICRMAFDGCCPDCKLPGDDCPLIWGVCNHAFHLHCILKWVNSQTSQAHCPMCRREWQFKA